MYDDTTDELNRKLNKYEKSGLLGTKYYNLLDSIGKFTNRHGIDISAIKKSTINKINNHCRLNVLNKACLSEPEDEISGDNENKISDDNEDEISDDDNNNNNENEISDDNEDEISDDDNNNNSNEKNIENNVENHKTKEIIFDNKSIASDIINDFRIMLKKGIISKNEELMNNTIKLMNIILTTNQKT